MAQWTTACPEWESLLVAKQSIIPPPIFPDLAEQALGIFKELRVSDLPGKPTFGECSEEWVFDFVNAIFGGYEAETGKQLIREYGLLISKKNTKSTIAAGIMLTALILCWREDEEHLILAPTKEVADNSFKPAAGMIRADEELSDMFQIQDHIRTITHRVTRNTLKVVAADTDTVSGKKSGRILVDELWLFGKRANAEAMFMEALGGQVSRNEGWVIFLTTQSDEPPAGVFKERLDYWRAVRDGKINDLKTLGVLYEFPDSMVESKAYLEPKNFYITNPNIGRSVSEEWIADQLLKNQNKTDGTLQQFLAKHLNIEIGLNLRSDRWAGVDFWEPQIRQVTFSDILQRAEVATVGIDGGGLDDLLGLYIIGRDKETREWIGWGHAWAHEIAVRRRKSEESRFNDFVKAGDLTIVKRVGQDTEEVAEYVSRINDAELLDKIGIDPSGVGQILDALVEAEIPEDLVVGVSQGWRLGGAIKITGLNETQKQRLEQLATEVDRLNSIKKANEENLKLAEYVSNLQRENANSAASLDADVIGAGLGDKSRERMREQLSIEREFLEKREDLQRRYQSGDIRSQEDYDRYNQELDKALAERLDKYRSHYDQLDELQGNWLAGAQNGLANWVDTSSDYYTQVSDLVGNTLDGLVDNMADALSGNKADWASWANSVLNELQKVLLRAIMVNTLKSAGDSGWFGSLGGMFGSSVAGAASAGGATPSGAYTGAASQLKFAKGGVMDSPDLSRFRNGVVNSPTMFAFAKGAGLMGEAGPEAIMPLTRTADGNLGVRMVDDTVSSVGGGGAQLQQTIQQHFSISGNGDAALKQAMQEAARQGANDGAKQARQDLLQDFSNRGQARRLLGV